MKKNNELLAEMVVMSQRLSTSYSILCSELNEEIKFEINNSLTDINGELRRLYELVQRSISN